jgi:hypothetical protein
MCMPVSDDNVGQYHTNENSFNRRKKMREENEGTLMMMMIMIQHP